MQGHSRIRLIKREEESLNRIVHNFQSFSRQAVSLSLYQLNCQENQVAFSDPCKVLVFFSDKVLAEVRIDGMGERLKRCIIEALDEVEGPDEPII